MSRRLVSRAEAVAWALSLIVASMLLVFTHYTSADPDSNLYAGISAHLADEPVTHWIAPRWWGQWARIDATGYYQDHPAGIFLLPALAARAGVPAEESAYVVGLGLSMATVLLLGRFVADVAGIEEGRAALVLLQITPVAFLFRVRANQEYPMLVCLLVAMAGADWSRRSWRGLVATAAALVGAFLVKGPFVLFTATGATLWVICNPTRQLGNGRALATIAAGVVLVGLAAVGYDAWYRHVTGEPFWPAYWYTQTSDMRGPRLFATFTSVFAHAGFYLTRLLWHPAPWSLAFVAWIVLHARPNTTAAREGSPTARGAWFVLLYTALTLVLLSPSSRVAERYVFSNTFLVAAAGIVVAYRAIPALARAVVWLDQRVPWLPALTWLALVSIRIGLGQTLRRL